MYIGESRQGHIDAAEAAMSEHATEYEASRGIAAEAEGGTVPAVGEIAIESSIEMQELSPVEQNYQKVVRRLLEEPDFTYYHPTAGSALCHELGLTMQQWNKVTSRLGLNQGVITLIKDPNAGGRRNSIGVALEISTLIDQADNPRYSYVTNDLLTDVKAGVIKHMQAVPQEDREAYVSAIDAVIAERNNPNKGMQNEELGVEAELNPTQANYQKVVRRLMQEPDLAYRRPNASGELAKELGFTPKEWDALNQKLNHRFHAIILEKDPAGGRKPLTIGIKLDVTGLLQCGRNDRLPFISNKLLLELKDKLQDSESSDDTRHIQEIDAILQTRKQKAAPKIQKQAPARKLPATPKPKRVELTAKPRQVEKTSSPRSSEAKPALSTAGPGSEPKRSQAEAAVKREPVKDQRLRFTFRADGQFFSKVYDPRPYSKLEPYHKMLLAIGHSSNFHKDMASQLPYLLRMANKGVKRDEQLTETDIAKLLDVAIEKNHIEATERYELTGRAFEVLDPSAMKKQEKPVVSDAAPEQTAEERILEQAAGMPYEAYEVLAEIQLSDNAFFHTGDAAEQLAEQLKREPADRHFYTAAIEILKERGLIEEHLYQSALGLVLTGAGEQAVDVLIDNPDILPSDRAAYKYKNASTTLRLLELISDETGHETIGHSPWLYGGGKDMPIFDALGGELGITTEAASRRVYDVAQKGFVGVAHYNDGAETFTSNIRITPLGTAYLFAVHERMREEEGLIDDDALWDARVLTDDCIARAKALGREDIADALKAARDEKDLAEMSQADFDAEVEWLEYLHATFEKALEDGSAMEPLRLAA